MSSLWTAKTRSTSPVIRNWISSPRGDRTAAEQFDGRDRRVLRVEEGVAQPVGDGSATISVPVGSQTVRLKATVRNYRKPAVWNFENHVEAVLSKQGCNMGICHGAAA